MKGGFVFEDGAEINGVCEHTYCCGENRETEFFHVKKNDSEFDVLVLNRKMADNMYLLVMAVWYLQRLCFWRMRMESDLRVLRHRT